MVAAVQLCLGATAKNTGRGTNLNGLIREGSEGPAIMRVTLLNEGMDAYNPNDYGNRITIERRINKGGGGGYKLLSYNGDVSQVLCQLSIPFDIYPNWSALLCHYHPADSPTI